MDAAASGASAPGETFAAYGEVVWSWRRDPGATLAVSPADNGGKKGRSPGRARISRKTIARGKPGCPGCSCGLTRVHFGSTPTHMGLRAQSAPGFPCALCRREGQRNCRTRAKPRRGNEHVCFNRHCERSEAIQLCRNKKAGLLPPSLSE